MSARSGHLSSRWLTVGSQRIHTRLSTETPRHDKPALVLLHGLVISSLYMVPTARLLAPSYRVYAPDLPGFGKSAKPRSVLNIGQLADALLGWMDLMGLTRPVLIGNSFGCQILVDLAVRYPDRVQALVLTGPSVDPAARSMWRQIGRALLDYTRERPSLGPAEVLDFLRAGGYRSWKTFQYALTDPIEDKLPYVQAPALVVRGERDSIVPQRWAVEVARRLPEGQLSILARAGHAVNYSVPEAFVDLLVQFLGALQSKADGADASSELPYPHRNP